MIVENYAEGHDERQVMPRVHAVRFRGQQLGNALAQSMADSPNHPVSVLFRRYVAQPWRVHVDRRKTA